MSDRARERQRHTERGQLVVRVSPCLHARRVLSQSIHNDSVTLFAVRHQIILLHPRPAPNAHTLRPCASDTRLQRYHSRLLARNSALQTARPKSRTIAFL